MNRRSTGHTSRRLAVLLAAAGILLLAYGLMLSSAKRKSATVDEQSHLFRGVAYLEEGATQFLLGHPLLGGSLSALPLLTEKSLQLPVGTAAWEEGDWSVSGDLFLWQLNENPLRLLFLGRLPVIWMTLLLLALIFRWAKEWVGLTAGLAAGLGAMALLALDPNVLAHGRFITSDLPLVLFFTVTLYGFWRWGHDFMQRPSRGTAWLKEQSAGYLLLAGVGLGLAAATKFNAALLLPILLLWAGTLSWRTRSLGPLVALAVTGLVGWLTIWVVYGFSLWRGFLPGGAFWDDALWQLTYMGEQHGVYLLGEISADGWLAYYPIAFLLKTPLPTLALLGIALFLVLRTRSGSAALYLLLPAVIYFAGSMLVALNIGYRYLLPILPLLFLLIAIVIARSPVVKRRPVLWISVLVGVYAVMAIWIWPDYVPFYNVFGGRDSWRLLSDSNVDWGQDLPALAAWQRENGSEVKLSYFGTAHPSAYGVTFEPLPTWPPGPEQGDPARQAFYPEDPAPGRYAISVTNLHGVVLGEARENFAHFRDLEPVTPIGGSIFVYEVPGRGEPADVTFSGLTPAEVAPEIYERFGTNDVRIRWIDARHSLIWPAGGGWLVTADGVAPSMAEQSKLWPAELVLESGGQHLYRLPEAPDVAWENGPVSFNDTLTFLGNSELEKQGAMLSLATGWRADSPSERPLKIFVHALDSSGQIAGQWDGLDIDPGSWRAGDVFVQQHDWSLAPGIEAETLSIGVYDGETGERLGRPVNFPIYE